MVNVAALLADAMFAVLATRPTGVALWHEAHIAASARTARKPMGVLHRGSITTLMFMCCVLRGNVNLLSWWHLIWAALLAWAASLCRVLLGFNVGKGQGGRGCR